MRQQFPAAAKGYTGGARCLQHAGRPAEAEALLDEARAKLPPDLWVLHAWATLAHARRDLPVALERYNTLLQAFPNEPVGVSSLANVLIDLRRMDEAERMLVAAIAANPSFVWFAHSYALIASVRRDWEDAARRWQTVCQKHPDHTHGYGYLCDALSYLGRWEEADTAITEAARRFPNDADIAIRWARSGHQAKDTAESVRRWEEIGKRFPANPDIAAALANRLTATRQFDRADHALADAVTRFASRQDIRRLFADSAARSGRFQAIDSRWAALHRDFPGVDDGWLLGSVATATTPATPPNGRTHIALGVPTWRGHFPYVVRLIESIERHCAPNERPGLLISVSDDQEKDELNALLKRHGSLSAPGAVHVFANTVGVRTVSTARPVDGAYHPQSFETKCSIINYKKLSLAQEAFAHGYDAVAVIDSEVRMFRPGNLLGSLRNNLLKREHRFSARSMRHPWLAQVQNASVTSVWPGIGTRHFLRRTYSWFNTLCFYEKETFNRFGSHMAKHGAPCWIPNGEVLPIGDTALDIALRLRAYTFEWIAYSAFALLTETPPYRLIDLDSVLGFFDIAVKDSDNASPTEFLWRLIEESGFDPRLLMAYDPPWIPLTTDTRMLDMVRECLSADVCLMFHNDRV